MKKMGTTKFIILVLVIMMIGLAYYTYLNNHAQNQKTETTQTEKEQLLEYDMLEKYPKTVRETVKLHLRYLKAAYNDEFTEEELFTVNKQIRQLFDEELLENNTPDVQLQGMKNEIQLYKENKQKFVSYSLSESSQIQYNTEDGKEYAKMRVTLVLKINGSTVSGDEEYLLRKNQDGKWKILGWKATTNDTLDEKGDAK